MTYHTAQRYCRIWQDERWLVAPSRLHPPVHPRDRAFSAQAQEAFASSQLTYTIG